LLLFNDGFRSVSQPAGAPAGQSRTYSAVSAYSINVDAKTAQEVWRFDYNQSVYSLICGSAYEGQEKSILVDYAFADLGIHTRVVGLNAAHDVVFDFEYKSSACGTGWNALPIRFDSLIVD
jgi:hypothetical protein